MVSFRSLVFLAAALGFGLAICSQAAQEPTGTSPAVAFGVYDIAQTMTNKPLAYEEIFVDQASAKGWVGSSQKSVYDFCVAVKAKGRIPIIDIEAFSLF
jgi:hypothetical protein